MFMTMVLSKPPSRRDRTRSALIEAGLRLFAERPIDAVAVDEIVASAGVAKGSFFNHFGDKHAFASAIAADIRRDIEARVASANRDIHDPLERLTGGMVVAVDFALSEPRRAMVMLRGMTWSTSRDNPLNAGLNEDIDACIASGYFHHQAKRSGLPFWLGACHMLMISVLAQDLSRQKAAEIMCDTIQMALTGMGVGSSQAVLVGQSGTQRLGV